MFAGARRGLFNRAKETLVTLLLFSVFVCGSLYILSALIDRDQHTIDTLVNMYSYYLPFLYSCVRSAQQSQCLISVILQFSVSSVSCCCWSVLR